jgi:hypothetical protein
MRRLFAFAMLCGLIATVPAAQAQQGGLDRLLRQSVEAYGGEAILTTFASLRMQGRIAAKGQSGQVERLFQAPDRLSNLTAYGNGVRERRVLIRDKGWRNGQPATIPEHLAMSLQLARLRLPMLLVENRATLSDLGPREQNGRQMHVVALAIAEGVSLTVIFDSQSGLILQTAGRLNLADGTNTDFTTLYGDYRKVNGLSVAMREDHFSQGTQTGSTIFEKVELNPALPANAFTP